MTPLEVLTAMRDTAIAREALQLASVRNALDTAADYTPAFSAAAANAVRELLDTRRYIAGLNTLLEELA